MIAVALDRPKGSRGIAVAVVLFGMYASFGMAWIGVVPLFPEIKAALDVQGGQAAWIISVVSLAKSVFPILAGILAARIGTTKTLRTAGALIVISAAIPFLPTYWAWLIGRFVFGVGGALWVTLMPSVVMQVFPVEKRALVNAANGVAVNTGVILALQLSLPLASSIGWRGALSIYGALTGVFFVALLLLGTIGAAPRAAQAVAPPMTYAQVLSLPTTWIISIAFTGPLALYLVFNTFMATYFEQTFAISRADSAGLLSWMNLWGIPASIVTGLLVQRTKRCRPFLIVGAVLLPVGALCSLIPSLRPLQGVFLAMTGVGLFVTVSPLVTLLQMQPGMTPASIGMVTGTMFSVTYILSSVTPGVVGWIVDHGFAMGPALFACCVLGATPAVGLFLRESR